MNADIAIKSVTGGQIRVGFKINTAGKVEDIHLRKSVEYIRRRGTRVISKIDLIPAEKDGVKLDAYRIQPVAFVKSK